MYLTAGGRNCGAAEARCGQCGDHGYAFHRGSLQILITVAAGGRLLVVGRPRRCAQGRTTMPGRGRLTTRPPQMNAKPHLIGCGVRVRLTDFPSNHTAQLSARQGQKTNQIANQNHNFSGCVKVWRPHMAAARKSFTSGAFFEAPSKRAIAGSHEILRRQILENKGERSSRRGRRRRSPWWRRPA